jgi:hypothetical protein
VAKAKQLLAAVDGANGPARSYAVITQRFSTMAARGRSDERARDPLPIALFVLGLCSFAFAYGVLVGVYRYFPYELLHDAKTAAEALHEKYALPREPHAYVVDHDGAGVTVHDPQRAFDGYTFLTLYRNGRNEAILINMQGDVLHEWHAEFSEIWPDAPHIIEQAHDAAIHWHGSYLFPNGDVLFNFESGNFPHGGGLVKIDKESNVLWALPRNTHHDLDVTRDGTIYVAAHKYQAESIAHMSNLQAPLLEDVILKVSPNGRVLDEISILDALRSSGFRGLVHDLSTSGADPTHLNTVEVLPDSLADAFPMFDPGDLLISLRNTNMIGVIDVNQRLVKWALVGMFVGQHDPDFLNNGHIMVFDNLGGGPSGERSRILEIDPVTQDMVWRYAGSNEDRFFSRIRGKQQVLPNGNVLITDSQNGRVLEVTRHEHPEVVWEYYNRISPIDGEGRVGLITLALRFGAKAVSFLD